MLKLGKSLFLIGYLSFMTLGASLPQYTFEGVRSRFDQQQSSIATNTSDIRMLRADVERNSADIRSLTLAMNEATASINRFSGIGIAIGIVGSVIVILQSLTLVKKNRSEG